MRVVIVGCNTAGINAARTLVAHVPGVKLTLFEKSPLTPYATCSMTNLISGKLDDWKKLSSPYLLHDFQDNVSVHIGWSVTAIQRRQRTITAVDPDLHEHVFPYDYLVLATGSTHQPFNGSDNSDLLLPYRTLPDAIRLNDLLSDTRPARIALLGAGLIGVSLALALKQRGVQPVLIDKGSYPLHWLPPALGHHLQSVLESLHIQTVMDFHSEKIDSRGSLFHIISSRGAETIADTVINTLGFVPNIMLGSQAGLQCGPTGAIAVDSTLKTSDDRIFAIGDCAETRHAISRRSCYIPRSLTAARQGRTVAYRISGKSVRFPPIMGTLIQGFQHFEVGTTGLTHLDQTTFSPKTTGIVVAFPHDHASSALISQLLVNLIYAPENKRLLGVQAVGPGAISLIQLAAAALHHQATLDTILDYDLGFHPSAGPLWNPLIISARKAYWGEN